MKGNIKWIVIFTVLSAVCVAIWIMCENRMQNAVIAQIKQGNSVIKEIDLSNVAESYEFEITDEKGGCNTVRVECGRIAVVDADCPDKVCVNQGYISNSALPIVCLPHKLSIIIMNKCEQTDAVVGGM